MSSPTTPAGGADPDAAAERARIVALLEAQTWTFAKTMPTNPHWYTLRQTWERDEDFVAAVRFIRWAGMVERFKGRDYVVWYAGAYKYWTMGAPIGPAPYDRRRDTILINRKDVDPCRPRLVQRSLWP